MVMEKHEGPGSRIARTNDRHTEIVSEHHCMLKGPNVASAITDGNDG